MIVVSSVFIFISKINFVNGTVYINIWIGGLLYMGYLLNISGPNDFFDFYVSEDNFFKLIKFVGIFLFSGF